MRYAIVIGIDEYGEDGMRLSGAVSDACTFRDWVLDPDGGDVPKDNLRLLLSRRRDDPGPDGAVPWLAARPTFRTSMRRRRA